MSAIQIYGNPCSSAFQSGSTFLLSSNLQKMTTIHIHKHSKRGQRQTEGQTSHDRALVHSLAPVSLALVQVSDDQRSVSAGQAKRHTFRRHPKKEQESDPFVFRIYTIGQQKNRCSKVLSMTLTFVHIVVKCARVCACIFFVLFWLGFAEYSQAWYKVIVNSGVLTLQLRKKEKEGTEKKKIE